MQGWVSVYRELLFKPIWLKSTPEQKTILITFLLMANHKASEWEWRGTKYILQPGQFISSLDRIIEKCGKGVTVAKLRTAIKRFEKYEFITNESTNQDRLITIVNWGLYQGRVGDVNKQINNQLTCNSQTFSKQVTTNNNENNEDKIINIDTYKDTSENIQTKESIQDQLLKESLKEQIPDLLHKTLSAFSQNYSEMYNWIGIIFRAKNKVSEEREEPLWIENDQNLESRINQAFMSSIRAIRRNPKIENPDNYLFSKIYYAIDSIVAEFQRSDVVRKDSQSDFPNYDWLEDNR